MGRKPENMRCVIIYANNENDVIEIINKIPGYKRVEIHDELKRTMRLSSDEERFMIMTPSGDHIYFTHKRGDNSVRTVNVIKQDASENPIAIKDDEVVKLHNAIKSVDGISSEVIAAEDDLK